MASEQLSHGEKCSLELIIVTLASYVLITLNV